MPSTWNPPTVNPTDRSEAIATTLERLPTGPGDGNLAMTPDDGNQENASASVLQLEVKAFQLSNASSQDKSRMLCT
eukprot:2239814-Pyramimonas_sp.AAC.1